MYVIVVGGGQVGAALAQSLLDQQHELPVIERNAERAEKLREHLGSAVATGDGCEVATLEEAGAERADAFIAATEQDEDNLVAAQVARHRFHVQQVVARVNARRNQRIFSALGFQSTVNVVESLANDMLRRLLEPAGHARRP